jgi:hypothetical protein
MGVAHLVNQALTLELQAFLLHLGFQIMDGEHTKLVLLRGRFEVAANFSQLLLGLNPV